MNRILRTSLLASALLCAAAPSIAATPGGPPIAYTLVSGTTPVVYLSNGIGSSPIKLYTGPSRSSIGLLDMRPGGNELAVYESSGSKRTMKIIHYSDAGTSMGVTALPSDGCTITGFDYHPSGDGSLIIAHYCGSAQNLEVVRRFADGTIQTLVTLGTGADNAIGPVRWLGDGSGFLLAFLNISSGGRIQRHMLSNPSAPVTVWTPPQGSDIPTWFDVAHCSGSLDSSCSKMLVSYGVDIHEATFDAFGPGSDTVLTSGADGHYSPANDHLFYRVSIRNSQQLKIDSNALVSKGTFAAKDWRP